MFRVSFINIDELLKTYRLSFDADGVLINSRTPVVKVFNKLFKTDYREEDLNSWAAIFEWAMKAGLDIDTPIITSWIPELRESTFSWFKKWMPWIGREKIHIRTNNDLTGGMFKAETVGRLGARIHFEDDPKHTKIILGKTKACVVFMPYTKEVFSTNSNRIIQIFTENNKIPNLWRAYQQLKGKNLYVAQS